MSSRMVVVSARSKEALVEFAKTAKCDRVAILNPYPQADGTYEVLRVVDGKTGEITNPTRWYNGLDCEIGEDPQFDWIFCITSYYHGKVHVDSKCHMRACCPPTNGNDGKKVSCL